MASNTISYFEQGNRLYFSPFAYVKNSFGYPWHIIGTFEIDKEKGYVYITPVHGRVTLQIKLSTYSHITFYGEPLIDLFNAVCNYKLVNTEIKMVYSNYRDFNLFKPSYVDHVDSFRNYQDILSYYNSRSMLFAMIDVGNDTYNVFTFEKVDEGL